MCMKMGPDAGRDFLSTKDPVRKAPRADRRADTKNVSAVARPVSLGDILQQYFKRRTQE